jgi:hypothetical protein
MRELSPGRQEYGLGVIGGMHTALFAWFGVYEDISCVETILHMNK